MSAAFRTVATLWLSFLIFCFPSQRAWANQELSLPDLLRSTLDTHPKIGAIQAKIREAEASVIAARGNFDLKAYAEGGYSPLGKYEQAQGEVGLKQPTTLWGAEFYAKYENGAGFAPYDGGEVTSTAGKVSLGMLLPLARGRAIDDPRLERKRAVLEQEIAEQNARAERSDLLASAAGLWWKWVVTGKKLEAYRELVAQAELRAQFLAHQAELGAIAQIEVTDNERLLASRRASLRSLELEFTKLCLRIGLYRRDKGGTPLPATEAELPRHRAPTPAGASPHHLQERIEHAPGLKIYQTALEIMDEQLRLQNNNRLPDLNLVLHSSQSFGDPRPYMDNYASVTETTAGARVELSWEPQQRKARGKAMALRAKRTVLEQERRYLSERLSMDFRGQLAELEAQRQVLALSRQATRQASEVTEAERLSFEAGQSSVLSVNLREQAALSAYLTELDSTYASWLAWIELHRLVGSDDLRSFVSTTTSGAPPEAGDREGSQFAPNGYRTVQATNETSSSLLESPEEQSDEAHHATTDAPRSEAPTASPNGDARQRKSIDAPPSAPVLESNPVPKENR